MDITISFATGKKPANGRFKLLLNCLDQPTLAHSLNLIRYTELRNR